MGRGTEQTLLQGGHREGPETYEKMLSITSHQRDANYSHNEIPPHTGQHGHHKQINKQVLAKLWKKGSPSTLLVGIQTGAATVENNMEFPQKDSNYFLLKYEKMVKNSCTKRKGCKCECLFNEICISLF